MFSSGSTHLARAAVFCVVILTGLLVTPAGFLAGFVGGMPDRFAMPLVEQWPLLKILWASNPGAATQILLQQPLLAIAHGGPGGGAPVWGLFFYPVSLAVLLAVSILAAAVLLRAGGREATRRRLVSLLPGMALLVFVTTYAQLASCCTGGPRWLLDIWLYSLAYNTFDTLIDWQALYIGVATSLPIVQAVLALIGVALLAAAVERAWHVSARTNLARAPSGSPGNAS